jgi:putative DNA primase/helicase
LLELDTTETGTQADTEFTSPPTFLLSEQVTGTQGTFNSAARVMLANEAEADMLAVLEDDDEARWDDLLAERKKAGRIPDGINVISLAQSRQARDKKKASENTGAPNNDGAESEDVDANPRRPGQAKILIALVNDHVEKRLVELSHYKGKAYARVTLANRAKATYPVRSADMRSFLAATFYAHTGDGVRSQAMSEALDTIEATTLHDGKYPEEQVHHVRVAHTGDIIHLDLGNDRWEEVRITADGWTICPHEVRFIRDGGMMPLPTPRRGQGLDILRKHTTLIGKEHDGTWALLASWLVACVALSPLPLDNQSLLDIAGYPVLALFGEQESGKTVLVRMLCAIIDPHEASLGGASRDEEKICLRAHASLIFAMDNLSRISNETSDLLCRIATGYTYTKRIHYEDTAQLSLYIKRPIILNGIEPVIHRADFGNRTVTLNLPRLMSDVKRDARDFSPRFERDRPFILGGLLDAVVIALRNFDAVRDTLTYKAARPYDYGILAVAAERAYGVELGTWERAHRTMMRDAHAIVLEGRLPRAVIALMEPPRTLWIGSATELLADLTLLASITPPKPHDWPGAPHILSGALTRLSPALRAVEIDVLITRAKHDRTITLSKQPSS